MNQKNWEHERIHRENDEPPRSRMGDDGYPVGWPRCASGCGRPRMDGHLTCGHAECDEMGARYR